jgi:hypothetical protein
MPPDISSLR